MYVWIAPEAEINRVGDSVEAQGALFDEILRQDVGRWIDLAEDRLPGSGIEAFVMAGTTTPGRSTKCWSAAATSCNATSAWYGQVPTR